jgi:ankyrin repeat protein
VSSTARHCARDPRALVLVRYQTMSWATFTLERRNDNPMLRFWRDLFCALGVLIVTADCAANTGAGLTAQQAFSDPRVVALVEAVSRSDYASADKALKAGANVNAVGSDGISPLLWMLGAAPQVKPVEYLLKAGANPNYRDERHKASAMYIAAGGEHTNKLLALLLRYKGDPNMLGPRDVPLLFTAVQQQRDDNIKLLVGSGADVNWTDRHKDTAANQAIDYARFDLIVYFLDHGLTSNLQDLASEVEIRVVPNSDAQRQKEKVIEMLKARGVKFPAFVRHKVE